MGNLSDNDRRALRLASDLQKAVEQWLIHRGVDQPCTVSPYVDATGQPAVVIKLNARVARAMIDGLNEQRPHPAGRPGSGGTPGYFPEA